MKIIHPLTDDVGNIIEGSIAVVHPCPSSVLPIEDVARKAVPAGLAYMIVEDDDVPDDRTFRAAWTIDFERPRDKDAKQSLVSIDIERARAIAHNKRRRDRDAAFAPHDERIKLALPGDDPLELDAPRQAIREKNADLQNKIDAAQSLDDLKKLIE